MLQLIELKNIFLIIYTYALLQLNNACSVRKMLRFKSSRLLASHYPLPSHSFDLLMKPNRLVRRKNQQIATR